MSILDEAVVKPEPYGVVLIIGSWNYPLQLSLAPVGGAIAAGNCIIIKPSEMSANTSALLATLLPRYIDEECFRVRFFAGNNRLTLTALFR